MAYQFFCVQLYKWVYSFVRNSARKIAKKMKPSRTLFCIIIENCGNKWILTFLSNGNWYTCHIKIKWNHHIMSRSDFFRYKNMFILPILFGITTIRGGTGHNLYVISTLWNPLPIRDGIRFISRHVPPQQLPRTTTSIARSKTARWAKAMTT